ncbi:hypothetical protein HN51_011172 [Arachis hypogaea]|uniref:Uncharacterized protein LOC107477902 n=2 Tax=Arachis TaxID=3817 RepID=A0A6P4CLJ6_ARADU|nr:uncharacterized protein LOC107477902 [Arachis duranensis]XP_025687571.1 protein LTO1 homolog [Arachis hypogaea]XP_025687572.1 protein LTO1 homolog [Arachis hypogaea]XP_052114980.1 uncharacterized protein LOC107477902 [Arachis duranensis]QHO56403.1 Oral cancer-overexpressed protein [Arachis hypogaea]RYR68885.1 hypothetical protein Ahy_A03g015381 isoform A [Arachis hypogaea]RYR68886.1 hypothetical protein Ahy_A03g015381 isoform B [Arachis hypogaea]
MDDIFDSSLNLEETHHKEGYNQGYSEGLATGKEEARQVGLKVGFEVGEELGFYKGCIDLWVSAIRADHTVFSSRAQAGIRQMEELLQRYPMMDPEDQHVQEIMDELRRKFKMVCSSLHIKKIEYDGYPKAAASDASSLEF